MTAIEDWPRRWAGQLAAKVVSGEIRIAAIPTALSMVSDLTTPYRATHPNVSFTILSRTSTDTLKQIENLEDDAGLFYIGNEPPAVLVDNLGLTPAVRAILIVESLVSNTIGLVAPLRDPMTPLMAALLSGAKKFAITLISQHQS